MDAKPSSPDSPPAGSPSITLVYDGECPVCSAYSQMTRIRDDLGGMVLVDARAPSPVLDEITAAGLDMDEGMVLKVGDQLFFGADAVHMLALLSTRQGWLNRMNRMLFGSPALARVAYPVARSMRNLLLRLLGRGRIRNLGRSDRAGGGG